ncbi:MAG: hypothetical protein EAY65_01505 [Alphaproteobacteria bacterium]|nr:MAG: hypothetical protein EAY65_01505 [Alphaproteobacteria bacterium]
MVATPEQDEAIKDCVLWIKQVIGAIQQFDREGLSTLLGAPYQDVLKKFPDNLDKTIKNPPAIPSTKKQGNVLGFKEDHRSMRELLVGFYNNVDSTFKDSRVSFWGNKANVFDDLTLINIDIGEDGELSKIGNNSRSILGLDSYGWLGETAMEPLLKEDIKNFLKKGSKQNFHAQAHNAIKELQQSFNQGQEKLHHELGAFGYEADIIGKRWSGQADPQTTVHELLHQGRGLQDFGKVVHLDTALKKTGAILASISCVGVMLHGVHNVHRAFVPEQDKQLEVEEIGHHAPQEGVNFLRLAVGVGELGVGAALLYRMVTGRHINQCGQKLFADDEMIKNMIGGCSHDHSHGHGK